MGTNHTDKSEKALSSPDYLEYHCTLKAQKPWESRRSRDHRGARYKAVQVWQQALFLLPVRLRGAPCITGKCELLILTGTACTACVLRSMPEELLAACRALRG